MTTWFAQNSSVNIDSTNQWNSAANGSGSWLTWASLGASDVLVANGKTNIAINVNVTCASITNAATGGTSGGYFNVTTTRTLVCSLVANNGNVINLSGSGTLSVTGSVSGGSTNNARAIDASGTCAGNVVGDITNGSGPNCQAIFWGSTGILSITGNCAGGSGATYEAVRNNSTGTVIITGNCIGATGHAVSNSLTGTVTITGNCTGGSSNNAYGVQNSSTGTVTVNGNCTGGSGSASYGAYNATTGTMRVLGVAIGNDHGLGYATNFGVPGVFGFGINSGANQATTSVRGIQYGAKGQSPTGGLVQLEVGYLTGSYAKFVGEPTSFTQYTFGPQEYLGGQPSEANVRLGTTYNFGLRTGTLAVPSPTLVAIGVSTDNTVGSYSPTGGLDAAGVRSAIGLAFANLDTQLSSLQSDTNNIQARLPEALDDGKITAVLDPTSLRSALGMSAADLDSQLDAILAAASAGAGTGARTVTITVNDGTTVLQNAIVRFSEGSNTFRAVTNASGVAVFNLDDASYTVAVTKSGYTYAGTTMVVNGTETATYSMTATSVTSPTNPDLSAIEVLCLDEDFEAVAGVEVDFRMAAIPTGDQNRAYPGAKKTVTSNGSGIARFEGPEGATVEWKRGTGQQWTEVTLDNDSVTNVTSTIGSP